MTEYITRTFNTMDGTATYGIAYVRLENGSCTEIGRTNDYRDYPRAVRARTAADNIVKAHQKTQAAKRGAMACQIDVILTHA